MYLYKFYFYGKIMCSILSEYRDLRSISQEAYVKPQSQINHSILVI